jgi:site-specific recombinase XerC
VSAYADRTKRPPKTLTTRELKKVLAVTGKARDGFRDHMIISLAVGCGLRESEIVALDVGDVVSVPAGGWKGGGAGRPKVRHYTPKRTIQLRVFKRAGLDADPEDHRVHLPDATFYKLEKFLNTPDRHGMKPGAMLPDAPLFWSKKGNRLSTRQVRTMFREWQKRAGLDQLFKFHALRHTAITNARRASKDIRIAQRFARHVNIATTVRYEHASDEEVAAVTKGMIA